MKSTLIVGTRGSKLALKQTGMVVEALKKAHPSLHVDTKIITTTGDKILDKELSKLGGKGLFIKEIEDALSAKEIDFAVHSMKDVPHTLPEGFTIGAILKREDPRDVLICATSLNDLSANAIVWTSSLRRMLQIKNLRPDLDCQSIRGNVDTRIKKLARGEFDAIVLATAGLNRMGLKNMDKSVFFSQFLEDNTVNLNIEYLNTDNFIPAVGQGALAIEIRENDSEIYDIVKALNHEPDAKCILAERAFLKEVNGGCEIPIGAYCISDDTKITINGFIGDEKTLKTYKDKISGNIEDYETLGIQLAKRLRQQKG